MIIDQAWRNVLEDLSPTSALIFADYLEENGFADAASPLRQAARDGKEITTLFLEDQPFSPIETVLTNHGNNRLDLHFFSETTGPPRVLTFDLGKGVRLEMIKISKGTFLMGSPEDEGGYRDVETQRHETIEEDFYLGRYELTQEQYEVIIGKNPSHFKGKRLPVETVSWEDAKEFFEKLSEKTGKKFVLPSEKQWEYACRAGTTTPFHFGSKLNGDLANCNGESPCGTDTKGKWLNKTSEVGSYPANPWGLYDMHGNVWEWCEYLYTSEQIHRVLRGGSWGKVSVNCRAARRDRFEPVSRSYIVGFRPAFRLE